MFRIINLKMECSFLQNSCQFMRHARRKRLTTEDFNKALRNSDVEVISAGTINRNNRLIGRFAMILINRLLKQKIDHFRLLFLLTWPKFPFKRGLAYHESHA